MIVFYDEKEIDNIIFFRNKTIILERISFLNLNFYKNNFIILEIDSNKLLYLFLNKKLKKIYILDDDPVFLLFDYKENFNLIYKINKKDYLFFLNTFCVVAKEQWSFFGF